MDRGEWKGWTEIISPKGLDRHMARIGQAEANVGIVKQMFKEHPLEDGSKLLVPSKISNTHLIPREELVGYLGGKNYGVIGRYEKKVPDKKVMYGFVFER
jgi:hypothetical protein